MVSLLFFDYFFRLYYYFHPPEVCILFLWDPLHTKIFFFHASQHSRLDMTWEYEDKV